MADKVGLTIVKRFTYRGSANEEWSNTYHFTGAIPADATAWRALFDAVVLKEKTLYDSTVQVIKGYGYDSDADDAHAVWAIDLRISPDTPVAGTLSSAGGVKAEGDVAFWVRWKTSRLNTKGKPIYLRKYYHGACAASAGDGDTILAGQKTAATAFGLALQDGTLLSARKITARLHDDTITSYGASSYLTTRTLKRRGKRPGS